MAHSYQKFLKDWTTQQFYTYLFACAREKSSLSTETERYGLKLIAPGGPVWLDGAIASANRDGEITRVEALQQKRDEAEVVADMVVLVEEHRLIAGMPQSGGADQTSGLVSDIIDAIARPGVFYPDMPVPASGL